MKTPIFKDKIQIFTNKLHQIYIKIGLIRLIAFMLIGVEIILIFHDVYCSGYTKGYDKGYTKAYEQVTTQSNAKIQKLSQSLSILEGLYSNLSKGVLPLMEKPELYIPKLEGTLSYAHAIDIAQSYYDKQSYKSAMVWAYRANQINPKDIKSWEIYTKSLEKIGTDEEIKKAQYLMQQIKNYFSKRTDEKGF
ncbi:hypothetical protein [Helicobacter cappadocius]|uniref:Uncharacterized protein n=1 Tax=Helicobacter cappadocius TaxID=3063998 RepID=A0AA90TE25_9HELI|nr:MULTISPECIES: hypothetical protein [unclassified Helicobacter]MDO7252413.1 hypothetical protein [Helicobacter sp. faydin-H75]MDP2538280.1 hypothetical protein [Helicobacter sp. faydin-H76]